VRGERVKLAGRRSVDHFCYVTMLCNDMLCGSSLSDIEVEVSSRE